MAAQLVARVAALADRRLHSLPDEHLTAREVQVLDLIADGLSNKEIAARLYIELSTVKNHVHSILTKLRAHTRAEAAARAQRTWHDGLNYRAHPACRR
jgi:DNA-binding NarL/FixJ family response regulator